MSKRIVTLDDKYAEETGRVFLTGIQALVRLPIEQKRRDRAAGLNTAGFISGYRGSPLGGYDQQLKRAQSFLDSHDIHLWEGVNEDLGATAVWGSQQIGLFPGARFDGVFGIWYGKAPGVDRTGDAFKHANFAGTARHGGVLAVAGDDHACKSSTLPSQSEFAFQDAEIPVLSPTSVQDVLDMGLLGLAMSRFSGAWVGMIALADTMDSGAVIEVGPQRGLPMYPGGLPELPALPHMRRGDKPMDKEARLRLVKLPAAQAFARVNALDHAVISATQPRLGIIASGQAVMDALEALEQLGLRGADAAAAGVALFKVGMPWPLEPEAISAFAGRCERILVVEHKRALVEPQLKAHLYHVAEGRRPLVEGKTDAAGAALLSSLGSLSIAEIAKAIHDRLPETARRPEAAVYFERVRATLERAERLQADVHRSAHFCSGCPHNTSTVVPEGSRALAGIGCHYMATFMDRADMTSHMGGEGAAWIGQAPFTDEPHVFVNLGDGTYSHSGSLAIRAAVSAKLTITYKILFNGAVAMTGGQEVESGQSVADLVRQLRGEGVAEVVVVADDPERHTRAGGFGPLVAIYHRDRLEEVQKRLREIKGVTVIIYDQVCATEKRRKVKRGLVRPATERAFINPAVCEGCGDCSAKSNCLSIEPLETEWGVKRRINQSSCNQDLSCVKGFCPSFVTVEGAINAQRAKTIAPVDTTGLQDPTLPALDGVYSLVFAGVGGAGVTTIAAILGMAAHIDGLAATTLDMTGLAQKGGPVVSHVRFAKDPEAIRSGRTPTAGADALLAGDLIVAAQAETLALLDAGRTQAIANADVTPTAEFITDRTKRFEGGLLRRRVEQGVAGFSAFNAEALANERLYDAIYANMILTGFAFARGLIPIRREAILEAIKLNGAGVKENIAAFDLGRVSALAPERLGKITPMRAPVAQTLDELIEHRARHLVDYQHEAYAERYRALVCAARAAESAQGLGERFSRAVAANFAKLMAYKDEYEVARLYSDGSWEKSLRETFAGDFKVTFHLAPPLLAPRDKATGHLKKIRLGSWMHVAFQLLAGLKGLRETSLDPFGRTAERAMERALRDTYEADIRRLIANLGPQTHDIACQIAELPDQIRGFGHVKEAAVEKTRGEAQRLWGALEAARRAGQAVIAAAE